MIKYKVINRLTRASCRISEKGKLIYKKGEITTADPETMGIFVFNTRKQAEEFMDRESIDTIIRVKTIGRGYRPKAIVAFGSIYRLNKEKAKIFDRFKRYIKSPPPGTMCYPAVEVLD